MRQSRKHLRSIGTQVGSGHYLYREGRAYPTLHISEDGTITRADIDLTLARAMTVAEAYKTLNLGCQSSTTYHRGDAELKVIKSMKPEQQADYDEKYGQAARSKS